MINSIDHIFKTYEAEREKLHAQLVQLQARAEDLDTELKPLQKAKELPEKSKKQLATLTEQKEAVERALSDIRFELQTLCQLSAALLAAKNKKLSREAAITDAARLINSSVLDLAVPSKAAREIIKAMLWRAYSLGSLNASELISSRGRYTALSDDRLGFLTFMGTCYDGVVNAEGRIQFPNVKRFAQLVQQIKAEDRRMGNDDET
jgi:hypothetical protein